jgi:hypothetical protein
MKKIIILLVVSGGGHMLWAQTTATLQLRSGVHLKSQGGAYLVLNDAHLLNNGGIIQQATGQGVVKFTGGSAVAVNGTAPIQIDKLELGKQAAAS